jgi:ABC-2 type transport system permease protein
VWPVYVVLPIVGIGLPVLFAILSPHIVQDLGRSRDPGALMLLDVIRRLDEFRGVDLALALTRYMLRNAAGIFLLLPVALASTWAAFSIVGEKQQRTLEPILATPITDREFLLAKLVACTGPTIVVTFVVAVIATILVDAITFPRFHAVLLPDRFWFCGVFVLPPLMSAAVALVTMRLSARATDPQAAVQTTTLIILPMFLIGLALFGRLLTSSFPVLLASCALVALLDLVLFRGNVRRFQREEILTRWK